MSRTAMSDARFLLRPLWLISHLFVVALVVVMINLGFWQLDRLDEKRERNDLIESRLDQPVVPVVDLLSPGDGAGAVEDARFREVTATGTYDDAGTVVVRNRSLDGVAGAWLVTPLVVDGSTQVGVLRGFVGFTPAGDVVEAPAPAGEVTVEGLVVDPGSFDGTAPGDLAALLEVDDSLPGLVLAEASSPPEPAAADAVTAGAGSLLAVPPPELSEGPHLGYAAQWFIFATIGIVGYPLVLRQVVSRRGKEVDDGPVGGDDVPDTTAGLDADDAELDELARQER